VRKELLCFQGGSVCIVWNITRHADLVRLVEVMCCVVIVLQHGHAENNRLLVNVVKFKYWETSLTLQSRTN
jgi:hypothetical protein